MIFHIPLYLGSPFDEMHLIIQVLEFRKKNLSMEKNIY